MDDSDDVKRYGSSAVSWLVLSAMAIGFLIWGFLLFFVIGDKGVPQWDFGIVEDIPGQSPYSTHAAEEPFTGHIPDPFKAGKVVGQHVMGPQHDDQIPEPGHWRQ